VTRATLGAYPALLLALSGCSLGGDQEAGPARGAPSAAAATIQALDEATRVRDYRGICYELFTAEARRRAGGKDCERLLRSAAAGVRRPRIQILSIRLAGRRAIVRVRSSAANQRPLEDEVELTREPGRGYRISALAG
jgi:hypothetical protein